MRYLHYIFFALVCHASSMRAKPAIDPESWNEFVRIQMARHPEYQTTREPENHEFDDGEYAEPLRTRVFAPQNEAVFLSLLEPSNRNDSTMPVFFNANSVISSLPQLPPSLFFMLLV